MMQMKRNRRPLFFNNELFFALLSTSDPPLALLATCRYMYMLNLITSNFNFFEFDLAG